MGEYEVEENHLRKQIFPFAIVSFAFADLFSHFFAASPFAFHLFAENCTHFAAERRQ